MPTYYKLTECSPGTDVIYTDTDLSGYVSIPILGLTGQIGTCYSHEVTLTPISPVPITIASTFNSCSQCLYPCFNITSCDGLIGPISVSTDLSAYIGSTISVDEYPGQCFTAAATFDAVLCFPSIEVTNIQLCTCPIYWKLTACPPATNVWYTATNLSTSASIIFYNGVCCFKEIVPALLLPTVTVTLPVAGCKGCLAPEFPCFTLTNCDDTLTVNVITDLTTYIGSTISVTEYPGECFSVVGNTEVILCTDTIEVTGIESCICPSTVPCYTLISCQPSVYPNIYLQSNILFEPFVGQLVNINGDLTKKYTVVHALQYVVLNTDSITKFCNGIPASLIPPINYEITSFIYNGIEQVFTPYTYTLTNLNLDFLSCTGFSCVPSVCSSTYGITNNYNNFADLLNGFFNSLGLPLQAYPYDQATLAMNYIDGDTWSLSLNSNGGSSDPFYPTMMTHNVYSVDSSNIPIWTNNDVEVIYQPYVACIAPSTTLTSIAASAICYPCYTLTNCDGSLVVNTLTDLSTYIGTTIEVTEYPGECFTVVGNLEVFLCTDTVPVTGMTPCSCTPGCGCPDGYVLLPDGVTCEQILTVPATATPTLYQVGPGFPGAGVGTYGANLYEDASLKILPIAQLGSALYDNNGAGTILTATNLLPSPNAFTVWQNRLLTVGVWTTAGAGAPINEWIGFSVCVTVPETKTYCIGVAADNFMRFSVDGTLIVTFNLPAATSFTFTVWHIIPITLTAGTHIIKLEGKNEAAAAIFGAEIYNATPTQIQAVTSVLDLTPYIIYSTQSLLPPNPTAYFNVGETSGYTCPPGYLLSTCDGIVCQQITQTPVLPCCYLLEDCDSGETYIVSTDLSTYIGLTITVNEITGCLLVIDVSDSCEGALEVTVTDSFANCTSCAALPPPCYLLTDNCTGSGISFIVSNDLSGSVGQVIKVCPGDLPIPTSTPPTPGFSRIVTSSSVPIVIIVGDPGLSQYNLTNCCDPLEILIVSNTLEAYIDQIVAIPILGDKCWTVTKFTNVGTSMGLIDLTGGFVYDNCGPCMADFPCEPIIIPELLECVCFTIAESASCTGSIELTTLGPITESCLTCMPPPEPCYLLTDCQDVVDPFIVCGNDLSTYVDLVIKIEGCGDTCWLVTLSENCDNSICLNGAITEFETCLDCLPPPPIPTPFALHSRRIKPGYFSTNSCLTTDYIERVNCTFALEVYNQMIIKRYGVTVCCDNDLDQWDIKKQGLDFELLTDPALCKSTVCTCKKPCLVSATFVLGATCYPPIITSSYIDTLCGAPVFVSGEIVVEVTPIECNCYSVAAPESPITIVYIDCCCKLQTSTITDAVQFCALFPPVNYDAEPLVITATGTCGDETCDPPFPPPPPTLPCNCYPVFNKGLPNPPTSITATDCNGNEFTIGPINRNLAYTMFVCASTIPIGNTVDVTIGLPKACDELCVSTIPCKCVYIELVGASGQSANFAYVNCNGDTIDITVTNSITVCAIGSPWSTGPCPLPIQYTFNSSCECLPV